MFKKFGMFTTALAIAALPSVALAASGRNFTVVNNNGSVAVAKVWTAAAGTNDPWNESTVSYAIQPKSSSNFTFPDGDTCMYDVKVQFTDGYVQTFANVNVCRGDNVQAT